MKTARRIESLGMAVVIAAATFVCVAPFVDAEIPSLAVSPDVFVRSAPVSGPGSEMVAPTCEPAVAEAASDPEPAAACEHTFAARTRNLGWPGAARL